MFGSTVLDLAIGLIFTFLIISLITSTATEAISSASGWRANTLLQGIKDLLNDQNFRVGVEPLQSRPHQPASKWRR
jgi:hypothetical protein